MNRDRLRAFCLSLPHATEEIKWESNLCFLIAEKMFAVMPLESSEDVRFAFKCTPEKFAELVEIEGIIPAPYMARNHWVSLRRWDALRDAEIEELIRESYALVIAKLPKRVQEQISAPDQKESPKRASRPASKTKRSRPR